MEPSNRWFHHGGYYTKKERFKIMGRTLTKTDCGELEFQLGYCTGYTAKTIGRGNSGCEIALIYERTNGTTECDYVIDLYFDENGFSLLHSHEIRGFPNALLLTNITKAIRTANGLLKAE